MQGQWTPTWAGRTWDVHFKPGAPSTVYGLSLSGSYYQMIISINGGISFEAIDEFPDDIPESSGGLIAVSPDDPDAIYYVLLSNDNTTPARKGLI